MPTIGGPPYINKNGGIIPCYEVFDTDNNRLDFGSFVSTYFKKHLKFFIQNVWFIENKNKRW